MSLYTWQDNGVSKGVSGAEFSVKTEGTPEDARPSDDRAKAGPSATIGASSNTESKGMDECHDAASQQRTASTSRQQRDSHSASSGRVDLETDLRSKVRFTFRGQEPPRSELAVVYRRAVVRGSRPYNTEAENLENTTAIPSSAQSSAQPGQV